MTKCLGMSIRQKILMIVGSRPTTKTSRTKKRSGVIQISLDLALPI